MEKYSSKEQELITKTLKVAKDKGWNASSDPMLFYIIVGEGLERQENVLRSKYSEIKEIEENINKKSNEIDHINQQLISKDTELDSLEEFVNERVIKINHLRENNESMAKQICEALKLKKKVGIQSKILAELKDKLNDKEEASDKDGKEEIDSLMQEIRAL